jgi:hypothetical protein
MIGRLDVVVWLRRLATAFAPHNLTLTFVMPGLVPGIHAFE